MRELPGRLADLLNGAVVGPFVGDTAPSTRVTVVPNWHLGTTTGSVGALAPNKRPIRTFSDFAIGLPGFGPTVEVELGNIRSVVIDRTLDQDAATMTMVQYNIAMNADAEANSMPASLGYQLGEPGYYSWTRGQSAEGVSRWNQHPNEWQNVLNPNAMLKVYQGYGGKDLPLQDAIGNGYVMLTGIFLVDTVVLDATGTSTFTCRDMAKLLIEQMVYPPLIPQTAPYPLAYYLDNQGPAGSTTAPATNQPGNYGDYTDIVRDLLLWAGWFFFDGSQLLSGILPQVYGSIQTTSVFDTAGMITADVFDKKPIIDVIKMIRDLVGFIFYIDEIGAAHFEPPNWWSSGNFNTTWSGDAVTTFRHFDVPTRTTVIPRIDERVNLSGYSMAASDSALRSKIIVSMLDPSAELDSTHASTVLIPANVGQPGDPLRGMQKPLMMGVPYEVTAVQQEVFADLIALQIAMSQRAGSVTTVLNPAITLDTQVQIYERTTGEAYIHYVKGLHTEHDLDSGKATMTLTTQWLGSASSWAIGVTPGAALPISSLLASFLSTVGSPKTTVYKDYNPPPGTGPGVPGAPGSVSAVAGDASATVSWAAPAGGGTPTSYVVTPYTAGVASGTPVTVSGTTHNAFVSGLTNSASYYFVVAAVNAAGQTLSLPSNTVTPVVGVVLGNVAKLISDMVDPNLVHGHGIPTGYSFYNGPEFDNPSPGSMTAVTAWGTIWQNASAPSSSTNTRVEITNQELWLWSNGAGSWSRYQNSMGVGPTGGHYYEPNPDGSPFDNGSVPAQMRDEPFGGTSDLMQAGFWFHFWPVGGRPSINPSDIGGAVSWFQVRLILDNPSGVDDRANCHLVASCGADWWQTPSAPWPQNSQVYYARFLPVPTDGSAIWVTGNSWTSSPDWRLAGGDAGARITANPPPFPG